MMRQQLEQMVGEAVAQYASERPNAQGSQGPACAPRCPPELQPYSTFSAYRVGPGPDAETPLKLSGGKRRAFTYSLSTRSNIPFIQYRGSSAASKIFSWNEPIEVPAGEIVTVYNASYHGGNIIINSGLPEPFTVPPRITVPVPTLQPVAPLGPFATNWPIDTRRAKRAFLYGFFGPSSGPGSITITARAAQAGFPEVTGAGGTLSGASTSNRTETRSFPGGAVTDGLPLGIGTTVNDDVHPLLDTVEVSLDSVFDVGRHLLVVMEFGS
jgi:hypothetical protein